MRIVHIVPSLEFDKGGPSRSVTGLASAQASLGYDVGIVAGRAGRDVSADAIGVELIVEPHLPAPFEIPSFRLLRRMSQTLSKADIVHLHSVWNGTISLAAYLCRKAQKPFALSPRGMLDAYNVRHHGSFKAAYLWAIERRNLRSAAAFHFLGEDELRGCQWLPEVRSKPCAVIPNGLDIEASQSGAARGFSFPARPHVMANLVFLGRLHRIKDLPFQIEVVAALRRRAVNVHLHLVGPDGGEEARLRSLVGELRLESEVSFVGPIYDVKRLAMLRCATAVLLTSLYECDSRTAAETMAVGGLMLTTRSCNLGSAAASNAVIEIERDAELFADKVMQVIADKHGSQEIRANAMGYARRNLSWSGVAQRTLDFYGQVLCEGRQACAA